MEKYYFIEVHDTEDLGRPVVINVAQIAAIEETTKGTAIIHLTSPVSILGAATSHLKVYTKESYVDIKHTITKLASGYIFEVNN